MENKNKEELAPYDMVSPGFEAVYTGEKSSSLTEKVDINATFTTDQTGNIIRKWSTWPWTWPGREKDFGEGVARGLLERASHVGIKLREWMDSALENDSANSQ